MDTSGQNVKVSVILSQGSSKLNTYCTAAMKATTDSKTGVVVVEFCEKHYGHEIELGHLRLPEM